MFFKLKHQRLMVFLVTYNDA